MQRSDVVSEDHAQVLLTAAFVGAPKVYEAYSRFDAPLRSFNDLGSLQNSIQEERKLAPFINLVLQYPDSQGKVTKRRSILFRRSAMGLRGERHSTAGASFSSNSSIKAMVASSAEWR